MSAVRVLLANEPRAYRETMAAALRALRPRVDVYTSEPEGLDHAIGEVAPELVVCSRLTALVEAEPLAWILLFPGGEARAMVSLAGHLTTMTDLDFPDFLSLIDQTTHLARGP